MAKSRKKPVIIAYKVKWQCRRCKRIMDSKTPHNCDSGFRKRNIIWRLIFF